MRIKRIDITQKIPTTASTSWHSIRFKIFYFTIFIFSVAVNAGFNGLTIHSRANCANNESIAWDWTHEWTLKTTSLHIYGNGTHIDSHSIDTGWETTWRNAAVHWGEGRGGWVVVGQHLREKDDNRIEYLGSESVNDCSIYDGWWDKNKDQEMNKKKVAVFLTAFPMIVHAGIQIVPLHTIGLTPDQIKKTDVIQQEIKQKGYHETTDVTYINFLLNRERSARDEIKSFGLNTNRADSHLRENVKNIQLAFNYKEIPVSHVYAYAPIGTYVNGKGWTGIKVFFRDSTMGSCAYSQMNNQLTHGGVTLSRESIKKYINKKPAYPFVYGNIDTGFVHSVDWYGENDFYTLDCASKGFNPVSENIIFDLASRIDKSINLIN